ncbi:MAG: hypothetical protein COU42_01715 [Candidatus Nealsonbacteria bacterium CG10_big_fil_rev_8_21_14_0_10_36_24]|uniref:Secreted protein n=2 Tax=Candidatus Nealsoniibacteriota TaxID=1817911 RepID=A0A2H0YPF2_9BACT|nr:MAG: hypothetical protein COU42_01715 [Candidatus Nealsonbacteria bacterium CG10_big_fil_rev_8_21_14_0_10_36_24]PIS40371.1 MAG: hypothetical protein COT32_00090 [Candidatus Nealsonbacteria bacterium CG08_land_8_20_14_0_20_36_22]
MKNQKTNLLCLLTTAIFCIAAAINTASANAKDCGGSIECACGDTVKQNYTMQADLNCAGNALVLGADNITINCGGHIITGNGSVGQE